MRTENTHITVQNMRLVHKDSCKVLVSQYKIFHDPYLSDVSFLLLTALFDVR